MDIVSVTSAVVGLAVPVFHLAKKDARPNKVGTLSSRVLHKCLFPVDVGRSHLREQNSFDHLSSLYNNHKALLDRRSLSTDLQELAEYASPYPPVVLVDLTICRIPRELRNSLLSMHASSLGREDDTRTV